MTRLARAGKCGDFTASGPATRGVVPAIRGAANDRRASASIRATLPKPSVARLRISRRVIGLFAIGCITCSTQSRRHRGTERGRRKRSADVFLSVPLCLSVAHSIDVVKLRRRVERLADLAPRVLPAHAVLLDALL